MPHKLVEVYSAGAAQKKDERNPVFLQRYCLDVSEQLEMRMEEVCIKRAVVSAREKYKRLVEFMLDVNPFAKTLLTVGERLRNNPGAVDAIKVSYTVACAH